MFRDIYVDILFACDSRIDLLTVKKIKAIERWLPFFKFQYFTTHEGAKDTKIKLEEAAFTILDLSGELFDFSRYSEFLRLHSRGSLSILINDTLGTGRKFNLGLSLFIYISLLLLSFNIVKLAGPIDKDKFRSWLCPYLVIGYAKHLKEMNWTNFRIAKGKLSDRELEAIEKWLQHGWRSRKKATALQVDTKRKVIILERVVLISLKQPISVFSFSRRNPLRWLNALNL